MSCFFHGLSNRLSRSFLKPSAIRRLAAGRALTRVIRASDEELAAHAARLAAVEKSAGGPSLWAQMDAPAAQE